MRKTAIERINDPEVLFEVTRKEKEIEVLGAAAIRLANMEDKRAIESLIRSLGARSPKDKAEDYEEHFLILRTDAAKAIQFLLKRFPELNTQEMNNLISDATYSQYTEHHDSSWECRD